MDKQTTIITHSGSFHADDIFAVATIELLLGEGAKISIVRTRDVAVIETGDYVVDVGGVYDESKNRFDHHQVGGAGVRPNTIPYASFGLVWKKFGLQICGSLEVAEKIDEVLIQPIDAGDNGVKIVEEKVPGIYPFVASSLVHSFYPTWKEEGVDMDGLFLKLVAYAKIVLSRVIVSTRDKNEAEQFVLESYNNTVDKRLIEVDRNYPWLEVLANFPEPLFVVYKRQGDGWSIKAVRDDEHSFEPRKKLPESWAGKNDGELEKITGVTGAIFCHKDRFTAAAKTKEAILKMAEIALNQ